MKTALSWMARWLAAGAVAMLLAGLAGRVWPALDFFAHFRGHFALLALAAALLAALAGARRAALAAGVAGALGLALLWPVWRAMPVAHDQCGVERLRVATANLYAHNRRPAEAAAALMALEADVLATVETSDAFWAEAGALRARYPYRLSWPGVGWFEAMLWSRRPIRDGAVFEAGAEVPFRALGVIDLGGRALGLAALHMSWPLLGPQMAQAQALDRTLATLPPARIIMGDFNAAPWSLAMARVESRSGARMIPGLRRTWKGVYPALVSAGVIPAPLGHQIDHILLPDGVGVEDIGVFPIPGSDHRAVAATLLVPRLCAGAP